MDAATIERIREFLSTRPVVHAYLFGSEARGSADDKSDVDLLVELDPAFRMGLAFVGIKNDLEDLLGRRVDLVTRSSVSPRMMSHIQGDLRSIYARQAG